MLPLIYHCLTMITVQPERGLAGIQIVDTLILADKRWLCKRGEFEDCGLSDQEVGAIGQGAGVSESHALKFNDSVLSMWHSSMPLPRERQVVNIDNIDNASAKCLLR